MRSLGLLLSSPRMARRGTEISDPFESTIVIASRSRLNEASRMRMAAFPRLLAALTAASISASVARMRKRKSHGAEAFSFVALTQRQRQRQRVRFDENRVHFRHRLYQHAPDVLVQVHIPKCAGTSVAAWMGRAYAWATGAASSPITRSISPTNACSRTACLPRGATRSVGNAIRRATPSGRRPTSSPTSANGSTSPRTRCREDSARQRHPRPGRRSLVDRRRSTRGSRSGCDRRRS
jgi:hypothetical protein